MVVVLALVCCMAFCIYKKCFNKGKKPKKVRERKAGRGRRKKDKDGEEGGEGEKKVRRDDVDTGFLVLRKCFCTIFNVSVISEFGVTCYTLANASS